ncbi:glycosyltransferase [Patescibacteria group bacterium]|nr:MAG: glycosyltransferase [Patescibacteria group bacterium]
MTQPKILIVITKADIGGAQIAALHLAKGLKAKGLAVTAAIGEGSFLAGELNQANIPITFIKNLKRSFNPLKAIFSFFEFKKIFDKNVFDIAQLNSSNSLLAALAARLAKNKPRVVFTWHGLSYLDPGAKKNWLIKKFFSLAFKILLHFVDENVFVCQTNLDQVKKTKLVKTGTVIKNGVKIDALGTKQAREFLANKLKTNLSGQLLVGSIGRLSEPKNYEYFIEEMAEVRKILPAAVGVIIGEGPERAKYENLIKKLDLAKNFFLAGEIAHASRYLPAFDLFILTSLYEGSSITLAEAMACGVPIAASATGGTPETVSGKGQIFPLQKGRLAQIIMAAAKQPKQEKMPAQADTTVAMTLGYLKLFNLSS